MVQGAGVTAVYNKNAIKPHSIAVFRDGGDGDGHVLFVESVQRYDSGTPERVTFSESNWGKDTTPSQKTLSWNAFLTRSDGSLNGYIYL